MRTIKPSTRGVTLTEVLVASVILAIMMLIMIPGLFLTGKITRRNSNAVSAKNIAQGYFEQMEIDTFANVGPANYPDIAETDTPPVWLDQALGIPCAVTFRFTGFGTPSSASLGSITDNGADWIPNEWAGDTVYIVDGPGAGQFVEISSNTASSLTLDDNLITAPTTSSRYMINNGKTVQITTTWTYQGVPYTQTIQSLVVNKDGDQNLGF